jgi:hypothetical protein
MALKESGIVRPITNQLSPPSAAAATATSRFEFDSFPKGIRKNFFLVSILENRLVRSCSRDIFGFTRVLGSYGTGDELA